MAATANHPDGSFISAAEPDEDIAAIAKQISDHAEVIYQTWKARGLAPNEILTCHNNLKAADKFGSVFTSKFSPTSTSSSSSPSPSPPPPNYTSSNYNKCSSAQSTSPMTNLIYNNRPASNNLEQIVNKFVVEDRGRLASCHKNAGSPSDALSTAKSYPSSIQFALEKFEKSSPMSVANAPAKFNNKARSKNGKAEPQQTTNGSTTWPLKHKNDDENETRLVNTKSSSNKSLTLPSKLQQKSNGSDACEDFMDEVAQEEKKLINALRTGVVINSSCNHLKYPSTFYNQNYDARLNQVKLHAPNEDQTDFVNEPAMKGRPSIVTETIQNLCQKSDLSNGNSQMAAINLGDVAKRRKRLVNLPTESSVNGESVRPANLRATSNGSANNNQNLNPVRPFLTRGSVAERVMMFEKCPTEIIEKRTSKATISNSPAWQNLTSDVHSKIQNYSKEGVSKKNAHPPHTTLQRHTKANKNVFIPKFHYPNGKPTNPLQQSLIFKNIEETFQSLPNFQAGKEQFSAVTKACGCPLYWKAALFLACGGEKVGSVDMNTFLEYWRELSAICHDDASKFMRITTRSAKRSYIIPEDLIPLVQDVVNTHPGLTFLKQAPEFHSRYVHTVICRVYYCVNQSWNGQISLAELRKSDFLRAVQLLEEEEDINQVTAYFSYEHFYVIYCKFWDLDRDHDLFISKEDLARHSDHALSSRIIDRIFTRTRSKSRNSLLQEGKMSYTDFVIFLLAEEDKRHPRAIEYWFRCMDIDGDGYLSMYELEHFYDEQLQRMEAMGIECLPFEDCLCQMLDMIQPKMPGKISLGDLKRCKMTPIFFDTFFNLEKYLDHEQRDPFASQRDHDSEMTDWDRYAAEEYELLVAEESGHDQCDDVGQYRLTDEDDDDIFSSNLNEILNGPREFVNKKAFQRQNNNYFVEELSDPNVLTTNFADVSNNCKGDDSSDDYAGDSDDCSL